MQAQPSISVLRVFAKDVSVETPENPTLVLNPNKKQSKLDVDFSIASRKLEQKGESALYESTLCGTITVSQEDGTVELLIEVTQCGLFSVKGLEDTDPRHFTEVYAPTVLFPYLRSNIADLASKSSSIPLNIQHFDFGAKFMASLTEQERNELEV